MATKCVKETTYKGNTYKLIRNDRSIEKENTSGIINEI